METIFSVGIDVGTTTTKVVFSRLRLENTAGLSRSPRVEIVERQLLYRGEAHLTPLLRADSIDAAGVERIVRAEYAKAGMTPDRVKAGAVIVTGESARKDNAAALIEHLAGLAGDFVAASAGPDLESAIAGRGSGAAAYARSHHCRALNVDVGGGTANAALFSEDELLGVGCIDVGGRLAQVRGDGTLLALSAAGKKITEALGIPAVAGERDIPSLQRLAEGGADLIAMLAGQLKKNDLYLSLATKDSSSFSAAEDGVDAIRFSGGVADAIYGSFAAGADFRFGDLGILLGRAIARHPALHSLPRVPGAETIRATVIGAGSYSLTVSGSTVGVDAADFPLRNLPVLALAEKEQQALIEGDAAPLSRRLTSALQDAVSGNVAILLPGKVDPSYREIKRLAASLIRAAAVLPKELPLITVCRTDMGKALGQALKLEAPQLKVVSLDGITAGPQDFLEIDKPILGGLAVPVMIKTLLFSK